MQSQRPGLVYGYHALDASIASQILNLETSFRHSNNDYDWLGYGVYFWENSYERAVQFGEEAKLRKSSSINEPTVLGAVIELGNCLDLLDYKHIPFIKAAYDTVKTIFDKNGASLPENKGAYKGDFDLLLRSLDCAVIRAAHALAERNGMVFDTVRAAFWEGEELYPTAGFREKSHIQIAVINLRCIKCIFKPMDLSL